MIKPSGMPSVNPFSRYGWHGRFVSLDGTSIEDFEKDAMDELLAAGETPRDWDGTVAGVCRLKDGRYVGWETNWGPTGDGFCCDAYGGDATIYVGATLDVVMWQGLSAEGRRLCGWPETQMETLGETGSDTSTPFTDALDRDSLPRTARAERTSNTQGEIDGDEDILNYHRGPRARR